MTNKRISPKETLDKHHNANKFRLWEITRKRVRGKVLYTQVLKIMNLMLDEMRIDLKEGKDFTIGNFGTLRLAKMPPKKHYDITTKTVGYSLGNKILRFDLNEKFRAFLLSKLDFDKTFKE